MANPWKEITDTRALAGKWWTSELNRDLIRRDFGAWEQGFDFGFDEIDLSPNTLSDTWETVGTFDVNIPQAVGAGSDDSLVTFTHRFGVGFECHAVTVGGDGSGTLFRITATGAVDHGAGFEVTPDAGYVYSTSALIWVELDGPPAGNTTITVQSKCPGGTVNTFARRVFGEHGPDCSILLDEA